MFQAENMVSLKTAQDDYTERERELLRDKTEFKKQLREQELAHQDEMRDLKTVNRKFYYEILYN